MDTPAIAALSVLDLQTQSAAQLLQAAAQPMPAPNNPPHLGNSIDAFA